MWLKRWPRIVLNENLKFHSNKRYWGSTSYYINPKPIRWVDRHLTKIIINVPNSLMKFFFLFIYLFFFYNDLEDEICTSTIRFKHLYKCLPLVKMGFLRFVTSVITEISFRLRSILANSNPIYSFFFSIESYVSLPAREEDIKLQILSLTISQDGGIKPSMAHRMKILVQGQTFINSLNLIIWDFYTG